MRDSKGRMPFGGGGRGGAPGSASRLFLSVLVFVIGDEGTQFVGLLGEVADGPRCLLHAFGGIGGDAADLIGGLIDLAGG